MSANVETKRQRRPRARETAVIHGAISERLAMLDLLAQRKTVNDDANIELASHVSRLRELLDELQRSNGGGQKESEAE